MIGLLLTLLSVLGLVLPAFSVWQATEQARRSRVRVRVSDSSAKRTADE